MNIISAKNAREEASVKKEIVFVTEEQIDAAIRQASAMGRRQILIRKESLTSSMKRALESLGYKVSENLSFDKDEFYKVSW